MKNLFGLILLCTLALSCKNVEKEKIDNVVIPTIQEIKKDDYQLYKPTKNIKAVLILFGGYPETIEDVKREFTILEEAINNEIAVLFINFNQKLWLEQIEKQELANNLQNIFKEHTLPTNNIYFGGFSSGGNVALLISNFLTQENIDIMPRGVFIVDSPIDLAALYNSSLKNLERNFSKPSVQESTWIVETLSNQFGKPDNAISKYQEYAIFTSATNHTDNIKALKNTKMRLYTEPDTLWWKTNRMADYDQMNAYYIKKLSETLTQLNFIDVQYIPTVNKGYRANGDRHPHSWSIVDKKELINWMLNK